MKLSVLMNDLGAVCMAVDREVSFITDNSNKVTEGCIFVCIEGKRFDGHTKAAEAIEKGCSNLHSCRFRHAGSVCAILLCHGSERYRKCTGYQQCHDIGNTPALLFQSSAMAQDHSHT